MSTLSDTAVSWVLNGRGETRPGYCQRWARQVRQAALGASFDACDRTSAKQTALAFRAAGYAVDGDPQVGDLLFKTQGSGGFGHVGIMTERGVAENSSTSIGRMHGAIGFRSLEQWGHVDVVVRLEAAAASYTLVVGGHPVATMPVLDDGRSWLRVSRWAEVMGFELAWDEDSGRVMLDGVVVDAAPRLIDGHAWLPIRVLAAAAGVAITVDNQERTVVIE